MGAESKPCDDDKATWCLWDKKFDSMLCKVNFSGAEAICLLSFSKGLMDTRKYARKHVRISR